jgi:carbonic anhydrase
MDDHDALSDTKVKERLNKSRLGLASGQKWLLPRKVRSMCRQCETTGLNRRGILRSAAALTLAATAGFGFARPAFAAGGPQTDLTPDQALEKLKAGNARFVAAPEVCSLELGKRRSSVAQSQAPWATVISCADSRVPPELVFGGLNLGELFVVRNAGNLVDVGAMGTIEYGAAVLGSPLIVVLGHERCGAVAAACDAVTKGATFPGSIWPMISPIIPVARSVQSAGGDFVDNTVIASAKVTAAKILRDSDIVAGKVKDGKIRIVAARYDLDDGTVTFF